MQAGRQEQFSERSARRAAQVRHSSSRVGARAPAPPFLSKLGSLSLVFSSCWPCLLVLLVLLVLSSCLPCCLLLQSPLTPRGSLSAPAHHQPCCVLTCCERQGRVIEEYMYRMRTANASMCPGNIYAMRENTCMLCTQLTADTCYTRLSPTHAACVLAMIYTLLSRAAGAPTTHARSVRMTKSCDNLTGLRAQGADSHLRAALPAGPAASGAAFKLGTRHGTRHGASWWQVQHAGAWRTWRERERERERSHSPGITLAFVKNEVNKREKKRRHLSRVITPLAMG